MCKVTLHSQLTAQIPERICLRLKNPILMSQSTKSQPKSPITDTDYPIGRRWTSKVSEPLTYEERAVVDAFYINEAEENAESVSAEELMASIRIS